MKKNKIIILILIGIILFFFIYFYFSINKLITITKVDNNFYKKNVKVISLSPDITELLFEIGADKNIIATTYSSNYPDKANHLDKIGNPGTLDIEKIIILNPDIIFMMKDGMPYSEYSQLLKSKINIIVFSTETIEDFNKMILEIGSIMNKNEKALLLSNQLKGKFQNQIINKRHPTVIYIVWGNPIIVPNKKTIIAEIIDRCGGYSIEFNSNSRYLIIQKEELIKINPDIILFSNYENFDFIKNMYVLNAVKKKNIVFVNPDKIQRCTPRLIREINKLKAKIQYIIEKEKYDKFCA